ncbi:GpE family phage tail protein [Chrysiogenes arsenatis]|nr:GpE family phage tail protein [Chrysiogenes arsenatis]
MSPAALRQAVLSLSSYTRWSYSDLMEMELGELFEWLEAVRQARR